MLIKYKAPKEQHVKFQRIFMGWLAILALYSESIELTWLFFLLTLIGIFTGTEYSPISLVYKLIKKLFSFELVKVTQHHRRYYQIAVPVDFIDHLLRIIASGSALLLLYFNLDTVAWALIAFLCIFMMLSAYFGFCLSALSYIFLQSFTKIGNNQECNTDGVPNINCTLAKNCFKPYLRCDSCHVNITQCLGTKFNTVMLIVGLALSVFLFTNNQYVIQTNIIFIMGILFWLGYQMNYNTDELTETNNKNVKLNKKLQEYSHSLEEEVQRRTSEIEHLVIHDQLTGVYNRYWFENRVKKAIIEVHDNTSKYIMAFMDLDKFKNVNDTAGHLAGDELLRQITEVISKNLTEDDSLARLGGDEFAILFKSGNIEDIENRCNTICSDVHKYDFNWEGNVFNIGVSIGVVDASTDIPNMTELFRKSDKACYQAKNDGRNRVVVM